MPWGQPHRQGDQGLPGPGNGLVASWAPEPGDALLRPGLGVPDPLSRSSTWCGTILDLASSC